MTPTEEMLNAALDEDAGDVASRSALADYLEEQGRLDEAEGHRFLIAHGKYPVEGLPYYGPWDWVREDNTHYAHACLPELDSYYDLKDRGTYDTRIEAERDAFDYLRRKGLIPSHESIIQ